MTHNGDFPLINRKILVGSLIVIVIGVVLIGTPPPPSFNLPIDKMTGKTQPVTGTIKFITKIEGIEKAVIIPEESLLFDITIEYDKNSDIHSMDVKKKSELADFYRRVGFTSKSEDVVFVYPLFTQAAYSSHGFYDYYNKKCGSECLAVPIPSTIVLTYASSVGSTLVLTMLNYSYITDVDIDKNPDVLKKYHKVIILHNEYVTRNEFDAITSHPNVIYLYPNALYAEVRTDYANNTLTLIRGHGYPEQSIGNGFDWKFDNSNLEYNITCKNMAFTIIPNGKMLNCYPVYRSFFDKSFLATIKES